MTRSWRLEHLTLVGTGALLAAVAVILATPSAQQYEISIYRALPAYFWALLIFAWFCGGFVILLSASRPDSEQWRPALALIALSNLLLFLMPFLRGYRMYGREDPMSHLGYVRDIVTSGGTGGNIYPPTHLLHLAIADASGLSWMTVAMLLSPVFSMLYFGAMFYLFRTVFDSRQKVLFGLPFLLLPALRFAHLGFRPFALSVMLIPLTLYLLFKSERSPTPAARVAFVVALFAQLLYHPLTGLFVIGMFVFHRGGSYLPRLHSQAVSSKNLFSLSLALFAIWYTQYAGIVLRFRRVYFTLFGVNQKAPPAAGFQQTVEESSPALIDILRVFTFKYGLEFVLFTLGFACLAAVALSVWRRGGRFDGHTGIFVGTLIVFSFGGLPFLFTDLIVEPYRSFQLAKVGAVVLTAQLVYFAWKHVGRDVGRVTRGAGFWIPVGVVLLLLVSLSTFSVYKSPLGSERNPQVTEMELEGSEWVLQRGGTVDELDFVGIPLHRHSDVRNGVNAPDRYDMELPPPHFNYTRKQSLGSSYGSDHYLTITHKGRILYPEAFPGYREHWRYTPAEFDRLERDRTVDRVYDNGGYTQYLVNSTAG